MVKKLLKTAILSFLNSSYTQRIIAAKDHASVQINVAEVSHMITL